MVTEYEKFNGMTNEQLVKTEKKLLREYKHAKDNRNAGKIIGLNAREYSARAWETCRLVMRIRGMQV